MKILKYTFIVLGIVALLVIAAALIGPKNNHVERSVEINAPKNVVFQNIQFLSNHLKWSPWKEKDSLMVSNIEGVDGTVGAKYTWSGPNSGKGHQTLALINENERVETELVFTDPWESKAHVFLQLENGTAGATKITWGFDSENNFIGRAFALFMNMDKMLGPDFERGLELLKNLSESNSNGQSATAYQIQEVSFGPKEYMAVHGKLTWDQIGPFMENSYGSLMKTAQEQKINITGAPSGLYYSWDEANQSTEMDAALPIQEKFNSKTLAFVSIPSTKALSIDYYGAYDKTMGAYEALEKHMAEKGLKPVKKGPAVVEEYITDPMTEKDTAKWLTKIYFLVE